MNIRFWVFVFSLFLIGTLFVFSERDESSAVLSEVDTVVQADSDVTLSLIPNEHRLSNGIYIAQTFNNCGPASLAMAMSYYGTNVSQDELAGILRPFNNPEGGIDDKSVFASELVEEAKRRGFSSMERPHGSIDMLQKLVANDISVIVRTWLNSYEDIGHYRVVNGYNKESKHVLVDDSYNGPDIAIPEEQFVDMWQPFNYGYILIYPKDKEEVVREIVGEDMDTKTSWANALDRAEDELVKHPNDRYASFNKAVAFYYLGKNKEAITEYERVESLLPPRMLWYQPEPIYAYQKEKNYDRALLLSDTVLFNGNLAFSELYIVRGKIFLDQGDRERAQEEFNTAIYYNQNMQEKIPTLSS